MGSYCMGTLGLCKGYARLKIWGKVPTWIEATGMEGASQKTGRPRLDAKHNAV